MGKTKDVREAVEADSASTRFQLGEITVTNLDGDVTLNGTVPSYPHTWRRPPTPAGHRVTGLHNHLRSCCRGQLPRHTC